MAELKDLIEMYYALPDTRRAKAWHIERTEAVRLFHTEFEKLWKITPERMELRPTARRIEIMLEAGDGRILGVPVVLEPVGTEPIFQVEVEGG